MSKNGLGRGEYVDVLLVDDNPLDQVLFSTAVRKADFNLRVHTASSGQEAMEYLQGRGAYADRAVNPVPDVVVLDLIMPGMSGTDLLAWRNGCGSLSTLPVIILSGANDEEQTRQALALGARAYLAKPAAFEGWKEVLQTVWSTGLAHKLPQRDAGHRRNSAERKSAARPATSPPAHKAVSVSRRK
jgi:CheY-like chemotaxis protein